MLQCLALETVYQVAHWFEKRFKGECRAPEAWTSLRSVFLKKPAMLEKGLRGFRAIALLSVFSKWYKTVLVDLLHEPIEWWSLHMGAERGVNCGAHAGPADEHPTETLGRSTDRFATRGFTDTRRPSWRAWT